MKLVVATLPERRGWWLCTQEKTTVRALAKFRSEADADMFLEIIRDYTLVFTEPVEQDKKPNAEEKQQ